MSFWWAGGGGFRDRVAPKCSEVLRGGGPWETTKTPSRKLTCILTRPYRAGTVADLQQHHVLQAPELLQS